jgi:prolyl-tRNA editing enzyme YbaK/EbsC (Cys-tRNA(Pro) deacylase)
MGKPGSPAGGAGAEEQPRTPEQILCDAGVDYRVHEHASVATVADIVAVLPFPADEHVKTLALAAGDGLALASLRGGDRVRFGALARALGVPRDRISPLSPEQVRDELDFEPGGVCPFVDRPEVVKVLDRRVLALDRAFCGSGRTRATLELAAADLVVVSGATVVDIAEPVPG